MIEEMTNAEYIAFLDGRAERSRALEDEIHADYFQQLADDFRARIASEQSNASR